MLIIREKYISQQANLTDILIILHFSFISVTTPEVIDKLPCSQTVLRTVINRMSYLMNIIYIEE